MKNYYILLLLLPQTLSCKDEQLNNRDKHDITITINAPTISGVDQDNKATHSSSPSNTTQTMTPTTPSDQPAMRTIYLSPHESRERYIARNFIKYSIITAACLHSLPFFAAYTTNRFVIQPLLENGKMFETVSQKEQANYIKKGQYKVPDTVAFPIWNAIREKLNQ